MGQTFVFYGKKAIILKKLVVDFLDPKQMMLQHAQLSSKHLADPYKLFLEAHHTR